MYAKPVKTSEFATVSVHNKAEICPANAWIVGEKQNRATLDFFKTSSVDALRDVFAQVADISDDGRGKFILFHAVRENDEVQHTNSKLPSLHIHIFSADFADAFSHISDPAIKSYAIRPNPTLNESIQQKLMEKGVADTENFITLSLDESGEAVGHDILTHSSFTDLKDFVETADDDHWEAFRDRMVSLIAPTVEEGAGGVRIVIDERYLGASQLTLQFLHGENLDRSGQNSQRYFEAPLL